MDVSDRCIDPDLDVKEYIAWFGALNSKYSFDPSEWGAVQKKIETLERRSSDQTLYLGITGEFSSGKSTFINALLRDDLLKSDILAATTCALTYIRHGDELEASIVLADGTQIDHVISQDEPDAETTLSKESVESIRDAVQKYTADEEESQRVSHVSIRYPNAQLRRGIAIVDTPGINVESRRHAEVTESALVNVFDACLIVIPAIAPCSEVLVNFINNHIAAHDRECIVVVTKIDLIRPRERERLMKHIEGVLESQTALKVAGIHAVAPLHIGKDIEGASSQTEDSAEYLVQFESAERSIMDLLAYSRQRIIAKQLKSLLMNVLHDLESAIESRSAEYKSRSQYLEANRLADLDEYVSGVKNTCREALSEQCGATTQKLVQDLSATIDKMKSRAEMDILSASNKTELRSIVEGNLLARIRASLVAFGGRIDTEIEDIVQRAQAAHAEFQKDFLDKYRVLDVLGGAVTSDKLNEELSESIEIDIDEVGIGTSSIVTSVNQSQTTKHVGAGAGAIIGSFVAPGIGTVIGGAAGWLAGSIFGPNLSTLKQRAVEGAKADIIVIRRECEKLVDQFGSAYKESTVIQLDDIANNYSTVYSDRVKGLIEELNAEKATLAQYTSTAECDIRTIRKRIDSLHN